VNLETVKDVLLMEDLQSYKLKLTLIETSKEVPLSDVAE
jgi:hypothetical protein